MSVEYLIEQYGLQQGALEIQYIEEFFLDFPRKKTAAEVIQRLADRDHQILMAEAAAARRSGRRSCRCRSRWRTSCGRRRPIRSSPISSPSSRTCVEFDGRRVLYQWIGGTRSDWRGQGHFRALTEEQEVWAMDNGFDEIIVKTKNRFYEMRSTLAQLRFDVIRFVQHPVDPRRVEGVPQQAPRPARHRQPPQPPLRRPDRPVIDWIASADDPRLDPYRHVGDPAWIREQGLFVAEGRLVVERLLALASLPRPLDPGQPRRRRTRCGALLSAAPATVLACDDPSLVESITGFNFHRGCLALVHRPPRPGAARRSTAPGACSGSRTSAIPTTSAACSARPPPSRVDGVLLNTASGDPLYRKAVRTSMGASLRVPYARAERVAAGACRAPRARLQNRGADAGGRRATSSPTSRLPLRGTTG